MIFSPSQQLSTRPPLNVTFSRGKLSLLRLKSSRNLYSDSQRNGRDRGEMRNIFPTTLETAPCGTIPETRFHGVNTGRSPACMKAMASVSPCPDNS